MRESATRRSKRKHGSMISSYKVFLQFIRKDEYGNVDVSRIFSKDCFELWKRTRREPPAKPEESFRRALTAHCRGSDGRQPFEPKVEAEILKFLRRKQRWECFEHHHRGIGVQGFKAAGYHEAKSKSQQRISSVRTLETRKTQTAQSFPKRTKLTLENAVKTGTERIHAFRMDSRSHEATNLSAQLTQYPKKSPIRFPQRIQSCSALTIPTASAGGRTGAEESIANEDWSQLFQIDATRLKRISQLAGPSTPQQYQNPAQMTEKESSSSSSEFTSKESMLEMPFSRFYEKAKRTIPQACSEGYNSSSEPLLQGRSSPTVYTSDSGYSKSEYWQRPYHYEAENISAPYTPGDVQGTYVREETESRLPNPQSLLQASRRPTRRKERTYNSQEHILDLILDIYRRIRIEGSSLNLLDRKTLRNLLISGREYGIDLFDTSSAYLLNNVSYHNDPRYQRSFLLPTVSKFFPRRLIGTTLVDLKTFVHLETDNAARMIMRGDTKGIHGWKLRVSRMEALLTLKYGYETLMAKGQVWLHRRVHTFEGNTIVLLVNLTLSHSGRHLVLRFQDVSDKQRAILDLPPELL